MWNSGAIGTLTNRGTISSGTALSAGGVATPGDAIFSTGGGLPAIANTGLIIGNIDIQNQSVTITGGSGGHFGSLTGSMGAAGLINIENGNLTFGGGNTLLGDNIIVNSGGGTVYNNYPLMISVPFDITGTFDQSMSGVLDLDFAPTQFGSITLNGPEAVVTLAGALGLVTIDGFAFMTGQTFDILNYKGLSGDFGSLSYFGHACTSTSADVWACGTGPIFDEIIGSSSLDLYVERGVPEPSTWAMMLIGFAGLGFAGWRSTRKTETDGLRP